MGWSNVGATVVEAVTVIIQTGTANSGVFVYNGIPASGNLIGSWTAAGGTDPYGNVYQGGLTVGETSQPYLLLNPNAANAFNSGNLQAALQMFTNDVNQMMPSMVGPILFNEGAANQQMATVVHSPIGAVDGYALVLNADSDDNTVQATATLGVVTVNGMAMTYTPLVTFDGLGNVVGQSFTTYSASSSQVIKLFATPGMTTWTVPTGVTTAKVECWGAGGGGQGGSGAGGGGGEYAAEPTLAVTPGTTYNIFVGTGGPGGPGGAGGPGTSGSRSTFETIGGTVLVAGNGGPGSTSATTAGGTGSTNTVHYNGGGSHANTTGVSTGGAGGGSSAGTGSVGTNGSSNSGQTGGAGGVAPAGGGDGGNGGNGTGSSGTAGFPGSTPGGGGGAGGAGTTSNSAGGAGANGQVRITYTPPATNKVVASISGTAFTDGQGNSIPAGFMGTLVAVQPNSTPQTKEVWHTPTLGSGWAAGPAGGTLQAVQYRDDGLDNLIIVGSAHSTSTTPSATIFTLASGWRPLVNQRVPGAVLNEGGTAVVCFLEIDSSGAVSVTPNLSGSGQDVYFQACVPLGNIS